jgi:hypothetical protein
MGIDPPRSQAPRRSDEDGETWDEDDDDGGPYHDHHPDEEDHCYRCEDTTVGEAYDDCGMPRCAFDDSGQRGTCLQLACEAQEPRRYVKSRAIRGRWPTKSRAISGGWPMKSSRVPRRSQRIGV